MTTTIRTEPALNLENGLRLRLISAEGTPAPATFLTGRELETLASFKIEKRRRDWLGGRYAAKLLIKETFSRDTELSGIEISYDPFGRPRAWFGETGEKEPARSRLLSITHSGPFCAAACAGEDAVFLGIDLEKIEPRAAAWYRDYFHADELAGKRGSETPAAQPLCSLATRLWTQKEALLKALGLGLKADPLDIYLAGETPEFSRTAAARYEELGRPSFTIRTFDHGQDYRLSVVWQKKEQ